MLFEEGIIYHVYNQGNNRERIFFTNANYHFFLRKMETHLIPHADLICYCLMPNHFHWMLRIKQLEIPVENPNSSVIKKRSLNDSIAILLRSYTRAINIQENRSGSLFRSRTKSKTSAFEGFITMNASHNSSDDFTIVPITSYFSTCIHYIHNNPCKAGLCSSPEHWEYSSAKDYQELRENSICNITVGRELLRASTGD